MDWKVLGFVIVGALALLAGCHTLDGELVSDDFVLMEAAENVGIVRMFTANWLGERDNGGFYRPMVLASWKLDHLIHGRNPWGYHLTNLLLHLAVSLMVFLLLSRFCESAWIPTAGAALFAVHPVHVEAVAWISGRTDLVAALFYLLSMLLFLKASRDESRSTMVPIAAFVFGVCSMLSKEIAYTLPFTLLAMKQMPVSDNGFSRVSRRTTFPYFLALAAILGIRLLVLGQILGGYGAAKHTRFDGVILNYLTFYLKWLLEPFSLPAQAGDPVWLVLILSGLLLSLAALTSRVYRPGIIWFWITMLPVLNICRAQYLYLPSIGLFWFVAAVVFGDRKIEERGIIDILKTLAWAGLLTVLLMHTWDRNREWSRTGRVGRGVSAVIRSLFPDAPMQARFVFINPPVNSSLNVGVFQNGIGQAVRLWYDNGSLEGVRYASLDQYTEPQSSKDIVWLFEEGRMYHLDEAGRMLRKTSIPWPQFDAAAVFPAVPEIRLPGTDAAVSAVAVYSQLANAGFLADDTPVAELRITFADGRVEQHQLKTGRDTAEWAYDRPDVKSRIRHRRPPVAYSYLAGEYPEPAAPGHTYRSVFYLQTPGIPSGLEIRPLPALKPAAAPPDSAQIQLEIRSILGVI